MSSSRILGCARGRGLCAGCRGSWGWWAPPRRGWPSLGTPGWPRVGWGKEEGSPAVLPAPRYLLHGQRARLLRLLRGVKTQPTARARGSVRCSLGVLPASPRLVRLAPLRALEPTVNSSPVTTSFTLCVASEQPAGCNYRLGLFRAVAAADQHVQQVDSCRRRDYFF